jgi:DnaJ-class molecular chaperone
MGRGEKPLTAREVPVRHTNVWFCEYCAGSNKVNTEECTHCGAPKPRTIGEILEHWMRR